MNEEKEMENIITRIKNRRNELMMSYQDLADKTGLSKSTLQRYETGSIKNMPIDKFGILAEALNVNPVWLMGYDAPKELQHYVKTVDLTMEQNTLIENFNKLNELGKSEANKRVAELTEINKYVKNTTDEISATKDNVIEFNNKKDDEEVFVPYKSFDELGAECNAAHADNLTPEKLEHAKQVILEAENELKLAEWKKKHNK